MLELLVIADDITGALDTGVQLAQSGYRICVVPLDSPATVPIEDVEVLVVDTESRHLPQQEARERVRSAATARGTEGARVIYKKTDSTLRGNIGTELETILEVSGRSAVAYLPGYPDAHRTVVGGRLLVDGTELEQTPYAGDPLNPVPTGSILELLSLQTRLASFVVPAERHPELPLPSGTIVVFDASRNEELHRLAALLRSERERLVFAGCAGFASVLPRLMEPPMESAAPRSNRASARRLICCGSLNPRSLVQFDRTQAMDIERYYLESLEPLTQTMVEEIRGEVERRGTVALGTAPPNGVRSDGTLEVAERQGRLVASLIERVGFDTLIVFGGDTLIAIMRAVGIDSLAPLEEITAGVPVSLASVRSGKRLLVVSKAGGFGGDRVLERIDRYLDGMDR